MKRDFWNTWLEGKDICEGFSVAKSFEAMRIYESLAIKLGNLFQRALSSKYNQEMYEISLLRGYV